SRVIRISLFYQNSTCFVSAYFLKHHPMFVMPEIGVFVEVIFTPEKLLQWQEIVSKTQQFLLSKNKH
ncbi:hypothetical protein V5085_09600, partial [Moellerella wisconsensis]